MMLLAITLAASTAPTPPAERIGVEARATIRVISAVKLRVGSTASEDGRPVRDASIRDEVGRPHAAKLVVFE